MFQLSHLQHHQVLQLFPQYPPEHHLSLLQCPSELHQSLLQCPSVPSEHHLSLCPVYWHCLSVPSELHLSLCPVYWRCLSVPSEPHLSLLQCPSASSELQQFLLPCVYELPQSAQPVHLLLVLYPEWRSRAVVWLILQLQASLKQRTM